MQEGVGWIQLSTRVGQKGTVDGYGRKGNLDIQSYSVYKYNIERKKRYYNRLLYTTTILLLHNQFVYVCFAFTYHNVSAQQWFLFSHCPSSNELSIVFT